MAQQVSAATFREIMRCVPSPVTVVTTTDGREICGMTAGSFTSICLEPPLVSFNVTRTSSMYAVIEHAEICAIHVLGEDQVELARWFAKPDLDGTEQLAEVSHRIEEDGVPVLPTTLGVLKAVLINEYGAGDSSVFVARVTATQRFREGGPLLYYKSGYRAIGGSAKGLSQSTVSALAARSSSDSSDSDTPAPNSAKS
jgi:flavin reductase (DIM6/NTAB) family NADH-FMN oxidoreductase RutF